MTEIEEIKKIKHINMLGYIIGKQLHLIDRRLKWSMPEFGIFYADFDSEDDNGHRLFSKSFLRLSVEPSLFTELKYERYDLVLSGMRSVLNNVKAGDLNAFKSYCFFKDYGDEWFTSEDMKNIDKLLRLRRRDDVVDPMIHEHVGLDVATLKRIVDYVEKNIIEESKKDRAVKNATAFNFDDLDYFGRW